MRILADIKSIPANLSRSEVQDLRIGTKTGQLRACIFAMKNGRIFTSEFIYGNSVACKQCYAGPTPPGTAYVGQPTRLNRKSGQRDLPGIQMGDRSSVAISVAGLSRRIAPPASQATTTRRFR